MTPEEIKAKAEAVIQKLYKLQHDLSDRFNSTHSILDTLSTFAYTGLDDLITDIEEIRDDLEDLAEGENS